MSSDPAPRIHFFERIAPYYDILLNVLTFGMYARFLKRAVNILDPKNGERILDLCSGTGRAASWMAQAVGEHGEVIGMDVTRSMIEVSKKRSGGTERLTFLQKDVTEPWDYQKPFDGIFISFSLHELPEGKREVVLRQSYLALAERGRMVIADFDPEIMGRRKGLLHIFFRIFEKENLNFLHFKERETLTKVGFKKIRTFPVLGGVFQITLAPK